MPKQNPSNEEDYIMTQFRKFFTLSFDDGLEQDKLTLKMMRKYGIKGTFNLNSNLFGQKSYIKYIGKMGFANSPKDARPPFLGRFADSDRIPADEIRQVYEGMEIATHGTNHVDLSKLSSEELQAELLQDKAFLQKFTDIPVVGHAFPFGRTSDNAETFLKENDFLYARAVTSEKAKRNFAFSDNLLNFKPTCWHVEDDIEKLVDQFIATEPANGDMIFYMWGHGYEFDFQSLKGLRDIYERIFDKIASHDEIIKCTNAEAFLSQKEL